MGFRRFANSKVWLIAFLLAMFDAGVLRADQYAVMNTGSRVRIERYQSEGSITHLFLPGGGEAQVISADIARFEADEVVPPPPPPPQEQEQQASAPEGSLDKIIRDAASAHGLHPALLHSVIQAESGGNPDAVSRKGARGLMQLMPGTARYLSVNNVFDPAENVQAGTRYLRDLLARYGNRLDLALAAYNAGPEKVDAYRSVPPYRETVDYVTRVINDYRKRIGQGE
jgi:soluble lytic murein transglycosylase-like protein